MKCAICSQGTLKKASVEISREVDGHRFVTRIPGRVCGACGEEFYDGDNVRLFELMISHILAHSGVSSGTAFKFMRKAIGMRAADLARLLAVTPETISRWETGKHPIERAILVLLGLLVDNKINGVTTTLDLLNARAEPKELEPTIKVDLDRRVA
jgi:putative zinc finger/helix-turn-helix YgiT family protein